MVGEELADGADAAGAEVIDVVDDADAALEADEILGRGDDVTGLEDALLELDLEAELLVDLVAADAAEVVTLRIEEEALEEGLGVRGGRRLAGAQALVDFLEGFLFVARRIFLERTDEGAFVDGGVDHADRGDAVFLEGAHDLLRERFKRTREHDALLGIDRVFDEDERGNVLEVEGFGNFEVFDLVEEIQDIDVARVADSAEQRRDEEFATTTAAIEIDVEQIVVVELDFKPGAAIRDDAEGVQQFTVRVRRHFESDAGRAMELRDDDALSAVDDEGAALGHHGDFAHVNIFILDEVFLAEAELHVKGHRVGDAFAETLELGILRITEGVGNVFEDETLVVRMDREYLAENGLQALGLALLLRNTFLEELEIGRDLNLNEIRRLNDFAEFAEVRAFGVSAVGHGNIRSEVNDEKKTSARRSMRRAGT